MVKYRKVYIYGAGEYALSQFYRISNSYDILGMVVSDTPDCKKLMNVPVFSIKDITDKEVMFVICSTYSDDIKQILRYNGFHNFYTVEELLESGSVYGESMLLESKVIEQKNIQIKTVIDLTDNSDAPTIDGVIVSLTSFPSRFPNLDLVIKSLKKQSWLPEKIILWVSYSDYHELPTQVKELEDTLFEIHQCEDLKSYKKLIPALEKFPDKIIVTADDDLYYWSDWLKILIEVHRNNPSAIVAHRVHRIKPSSINCYLEWEHSSISSDSQQISLWNFPTGVSGALYPPGCFQSDVTNRDLFMKLCPTGDDIWFYWMFRMNGWYAVGTGVKGSLIDIESYRTPKLYEKNVFHGGNDRQINNMINKYGFIDV